MKKSKKDDYLIAEKMRAVTINKLFPIEDLESIFLVDFKNRILQVDYDKIFDYYEYYNELENFNVWFRLTPSVSINFQEVLNYFKRKKFTLGVKEIYTIYKLNKNTFRFILTNKKTDPTNKNLNPKSKKNINTNKVEKTSINKKSKSKKNINTNKKK